MAEDRDLVRLLGVRRECCTHLEQLPGAEQHGYHARGLWRRSKAEAYGNPCECELATYEEVHNAIENGQAKTIDDVRRDVRLGMGPCQGGFCTYRVAGMLHSLRRQTVEEANVALRDLLNAGKG
jgi:glycerol-3-phosphate dehydrogenase